MGLGIERRILKAEGQTSGGHKKIVSIYADYGGVVPDCCRIAAKGISLFIKPLFMEPHLTSPSIFYTLAPEIIAPQIRQPGRGAYGLEKMEAHFL
jgi:hypothetical protein